MKSLRLSCLLVLVLLGSACSRQPTTYEGRVYYTVQESSHFRIEWTAPEGGSAHRVLEEADEARSPSVSPEGRKLAYLRGSPPQVHVLDLRSQEDERISEPGGTNSRPSWCPTGRNLAYLRYREGGKVQLVLQPLGGKPKVLCEAQNLGLPVWSTMGARILYPEIDAAGTVHLYSRRADGSDPELLLEGADQLSMGSEGSGMALVLADKLQIYDLFQKKMSVVLDKAGITSPTWSPSHKQLAFVRDRQVWTVGLDGSEPRQVTRAEVPVLDVAWGKAP